MPVWIVPPVPGLIEPVAAPDLWVDDMGACEILPGGIIRKCYFAEESPTDGSDVQRVIKVWIRSHLQRTPLMLAKNAQINQYLVRQAVDPSPLPSPGGYPPKVVR